MSGRTQFWLGSVMLALAVGLLVSSAIAPRPLYAQDGIGEGMTREDHAHIASQLFAAYSKVKDVRALASVIGEEELTPLDTQYLEFGDQFEREFLTQGYYDDRSIEETLVLGWRIISSLPREELYRITDEEIAKYYGK